MPFQTASVVTDEKTTLEAVWDTESYEFQWPLRTLIRLPSAVTLSSQKLLLEKPTWSEIPLLPVAPIHRMVPSCEHSMLADLL